MISAAEARQQIVTNVRLEQLELIQHRIIQAIRNNETTAIITNPAKQNMKILTALGFSTESTNNETRIYW